MCDFRAWLLLLEVGKLEYDWEALQYIFAEDFRASPAVCLSPFQSLPVLFVVFFSFPEPQLNHHFSPEQRTRENLVG
jgi:hypothetical protein